MRQTLRISVTLLGNRFHGDDWPSSPARLFRALLSGSMAGGYRKGWPRVEPALRWLEQLPAPSIHACNARLSQAYRISVPNNDMDIAARKWLQGHFYDPSNLRTMKKVQPFVFESDGPHLIYSWAQIEIDELTLAGLREAVHSLHTLGWGADMAFAQVSVNGDDLQTGGCAQWMPARSGEKVLPIPAEGSLDDLRDTHGRFLGCVGRDGVDPDTRPSVYRLQPYSEGVSKRAFVVFELRTLDGNGLYSKHSEAAMVIAAWLRHAVSQALLQEEYDPSFVDAVALGHGQTQESGLRLSYLPLPTIGHLHADGRIRRVIITGPADSAEEIIRLLARKLHGQTLTEDGGKEVCRLMIPDDTNVTSKYTRKGRNWETVTPIVLHGHNALRGQISNHKTERLLFQSFDGAGFNPDNVEQMTFQAAPYWPNTGSARSIRVPAHLKTWPRYHISVVFREPVKGPLIVGIGRHYGIGTFACSD